MKLKSILRMLIDLSPVTKRWGRVWGIRAYYTLGGLLVIILLLSIGPEEEKVQLTWGTVQRGSFQVDVVESGEIQAVSQQLVTAPMTWSSSLQITKLVPEGSFVKAGDPLVWFDVAQIQTELDLEKNNMSTLQADLLKLQAEQSRTMTNLENQLKLAEYSHEQAKLRLEMRKFESEAKKEESRLQLKQAEIDLAKVQKQLESQRIIHRSQTLKAETAISQAKSEVKELVDRLESFTLKAPNDGMVVYKEVGSFFARERLKEGYAANPWEELISIPDLENMQVKLYINEVDRTKIVPGLKAKIYLEAYADMEFEGSVREVAKLGQQITTDSKLKGFVVYVDLEGTDPRLKPGMTAKVHILFETLEDALYIPIGTVFEQDGKSVVFPKGKKKPVPVELGPRNDGYVVVQKGLKPGMKLSWMRQPEYASVKGRSEEQKRIDDLNRKLTSSFEIFKERGILHDYDIPSSETSMEKKPAVDISKLPPALRQRLQKVDSSKAGK